MRKNILSNEFNLIISLNECYLRNLNFFKYKLLLFVKKYKQREIGMALYQDEKKKGNNNLYIKKGKRERGIY